MRTFVALQQVRPPLQRPHTRPPKLANIAVKSYTTFPLRSGKEVGTLIPKEQPYIVLELFSRLSLLRVRKTIFESPGTDTIHSLLSAP